MQEYHPGLVAFDADPALGQVLARLMQALEAAEAQAEVPAAFKAGLLGAVPRLRRDALSPTHHGADADGTHAAGLAGAAEQRASLRDLQGALDRREPAQREALLLIAVEGPSCEAAAVIGCPAGTVKSRVGRARDRLGQDLGRQVPPREVPNPSGAA